MYAKAWESAYPDDRVIGVGITEVGETTEYYVEVDPDYAELVEDLSIGKITDYTSKTYRDLEEENWEKAMVFEHGWMSELELLRRRQCKVEAMSIQL